MRSTHRKAVARCTAIAAIAVMATVFTTSSVGIAQPPTSPSAPSSDLSTAPKEVLKDPQGVVRQVDPKSPVPAPVGAAQSDASAAAQAHAGGVEKVFTGDSVGTLVVDKVLPVGEGSTVRLRQEVDGVPVFGASVAQSLAKDGSLLSATGSLTQKSQGRYPDGASKAVPQQASAAAVKAIADQTKTPADKLAVADSKVYWYDPKLAAKNEAQSVAVPAYKVDVTGDGEKDKPGRWVVFVDANDTAKVLDSWSDTKQLNRVVCDANSTVVDLNSATDPTQCGTPDAFQATRTEGQPPSGIADVDSIYDFFGATENFYHKYTPLQSLSDFIGNDTGDGNGKALRGTVRICTADQCPYANAFWNNDHMAYGEGVSTEDITGHELTHGVTQNVNGLIYRDDSGAINESMSDVFGEFTFLTDTSNPLNTPDNRWKLGVGSSLGVIRDMKDPHAHQQPDSYHGQYWYTGQNQSVLVHTNSGVGNKAAELIVDGGSLNGQNVSGIGIEKTAQLYWTTQTMLTSNATYGTLGSTLNSACKANVANNVAGTTAADCTQVASAVQAVQMPSLANNA
ncbi:M4 family metallopeptidase [Nocardia terpenica]|uniref:M4 family metallopeptidase n=1 Tax=Nocardia terpenica TaxID=455432 RepID=UPI002FE0A286